MRFREGDRVTVRSGDMEGTGTVTRLFEHDNYPIGVTHDESSDWEYQWSHAESVVYPVECERHGVYLWHEGREKYFCPFCEGRE